MCHGGRFEGVDRLVRTLSLLLLLGLVAPALVACGSADTSDSERRERVDRESREEPGLTGDKLSGSIDSLLSGFGDNSAVPSEPSPSARDKATDQQTGKTGSASSLISGLVSSKATDRDETVDLTRVYVPDVYGIKLIGAANQTELQNFRPLDSGSTDSPENLYSAMKKQVDDLPHETVIQPDVHGIALVIAFDCSQVGNISLNASYRLIDVTVPNDPFLMITEPILVERKQGSVKNDHTARGCITTKGLQMPSDGWPVGSFRIDVLDDQGNIMDSESFEVSENKPYQPAAISPLNSGVAPLQIELDNAGSLGSTTPVEIRINSTFIIEPNELDLKISYDDGRYTNTATFSNANRILPAEAFVYMNYHYTRLDQSLTGTAITAVLAFVPEGDLECWHDVAASDLRRLHAFDSRGVYDCDWIPQGGANEYRPSPNQPGWCYHPGNFDVMVPCEGDSIPDDNRHLLNIPPTATPRRP